MSPGDILQGLPGEALLRTGLSDLTEGRRTVAACLAGIAGTRLIRAGLLPPSTAPWMSAELDLYRLLRGEAGDAYARYNALLRELVSFEQALDRRTRESGARETRS